jgi:hypothetical protein
MLGRLMARMAGSRTTSVARNVLGSQVQKRTYMDRATYKSEVPDHVKEVVERKPLPTQDVGSGTCRIQANAARDQMQSALIDAGKPLKQPTSSVRWSEENAKRVRERQPAVVDGEGAATPSSEWARGDHHAVAVLSPTKDGTKFVVHDPDRTHHPKTLQAHQEGRAEPRHNLRVMSHEELQAVAPRVIPGEPFEGPTIVPAVEHGGAKKSWFDWWK